MTMRVAGSLRLAAALLAVSAVATLLLAHRNGHAAQAVFRGVHRHRADRLAARAQLRDVVEAPWGFREAGSDADLSRMASHPLLNQWIVQLDRDAVESDAVLAEHGLRLVRTLPGSGSEGVALLVQSDEVPCDVGDQPCFDRAQQAIASDTRVVHVSPHLQHRGVPRAFSPPTDPLYAQQWHLQQDLAANSNYTGHDVRAEDAWAASITGNGTVIAIVDTGMECLHPDLTCSTELSFDYKTMAPPALVPADQHGTRVAGLAAGNAEVTCGVGVAFSAALADLPLINDDGSYTDAQFSDTMLHLLDDVDILVSAFGPEDTGLIKSQLTTPQAAALSHGTKDGRGGLGRIYIWAAGNGAAALDRADYDAFTVSRHTIGVGASAEDGLPASYSEPGACILVAAPATEAGLNGIRTTGETGSCDDRFDGTSAAAAQVGGVAALMLDANPQLSWRDVQHILVQSSRRTAPEVDNDPFPWFSNAAGHDVSDWLGFGVVDAGGAVAHAQSIGNGTRPGFLYAPAWQHVARQGLALPVVVGPNGEIIYIIDVPYVGNDAPALDMVVDQVDVFVDIAYPSRGELTIYMLSPATTLTIFAEPNPADTTKNLKHTFASVQLWDEYVHGQWLLVIEPGDASSDQPVIQDVLVTFNGRLSGVDNTIPPIDVVTVILYVVRAGLALYWIYTMHTIGADKYISAAVAASYSLTAQGEPGSSTTAGAKGSNGKRSQGSRGSRGGSSGGSRGSGGARKRASSTGSRASRGTGGSRARGSRGSRGSGASGTGSRGARRSGGGRRGSSSGAGQSGGSRASGGRGSRGSRASGGRDGKRRKKRRGSKAGDA